MAEPLNAVMMLGDDAVPTPDERSRLVREAVRVFLAAYGAPATTHAVAPPDDTASTFVS